MHTHSPNASSVPATPHLTEDPAVRLAAELAGARAALKTVTPDEDGYDALGEREADLEEHLLKTKPTSVGGLIAVLEQVRVDHGARCAAAKTAEDVFEVASATGLANAVEFLKGLRWADYQSVGSDASLVQAAAEAEKLMEDLRARDAAKRKVSERARGRILDKVNELDDAVFAATPRTLAGAAAVLRRLLDPEIGMDGGDKPTDVPALQRILDVLDGVAGVGNASGDAALFAIERELAEARKAQSAVDEGAEPKKYKALGDKITRLILKLMRAPASTPQGIIAKIMENADILPPDGGKDATFESYMIFHVLRDLRRMDVASAEPDAAALALHAEYKAAVGRVAQIDGARQVTDDELNAATRPMYKLEDRIPATPGVTLEMLATKVMAIYGTVRREDQGTPDSETNRGLLQLRAFRDELAAATGLQVVDPEFPFSKACLPSAGFAVAAE